MENRPLDVAAAVNTSTPDVRQPEPIVSSAGASRSVSGKTQIHVVKRAETLSGIADSYGTTMAALRDLNKLKRRRVGGATPEGAGGENRRRHYRRQGENAGQEAV